MVTQEEAAINHYESLLGAKNLSEQYYQAFPTSGRPVDRETMARMMTERFYGVDMTVVLAKQDAGANKTTERKYFREVRILSMEPGTWSVEISVADQSSEDLKSSLDTIAELLHDSHNRADPEKLDSFAYEVKVRDGIESIRIKAAGSAESIATKIGSITGIM